MLDRVRKFTEDFLGVTKIFIRRDDLRHEALDNTIFARFKVLENADHFLNKSLNAGERQGLTQSQRFDEIHRKQAATCHRIDTIHKSNSHIFFALYTAALF